MSDMMKAVGILQAVRNELRANQPGLCWGDLSVAIDEPATGGGGGGCRLQ